ncbi:MAG: threonylcarbamoyl-AMP synthase [Gammaproteobacteria bacterium]|nr:threonylcarbamoyl-AMP synthase [Gammaproteobacteria bacterium]MCP4090853.1 threonylcarbamoyl-AMP synthase [Gammaproteobacteria bacterium]MCP4275539.1 threonylcarbamoyl-AMP synthase [Gammaproteobacteria bacterium]MCP4832261.1 threonylcarbamoyl-AMP synthase [Gammaproteobacteria bacterium]MCP4930315.1 threonylcarbamoyl-AMP synthase [Gammaproteobacteria bacterium]
MTEVLEIHPVNPEPRCVSRVVDELRSGKLVVYPTDSCYAFGFHMGDKNPIREIQRIRQTARSHNFTLICRDLAEISTYAKVDNACYRLLKAHTPGPYTFILPATRDVPRRLQNPRSKTIGIRVPDHPVPQAILKVLGESFMSSTLILPGDELPMTDADEIEQRLRGDVDLIINAGSCGIEPTTVVDLTQGYPVLLREGKGKADDFV